MGTPTAPEEAGSPSTDEGTATLLVQSTTAGGSVLASGEAAVSAGMIAAPVATTGGYAVGRDLHVHQAPLGPTPAWQSVSGFSLRGRRHRSSFVGRDAAMAQMETLLAERGAAPVVLTGMGGVGKSQLAVEYAHRGRASNQLTWMVSAESVSSLVQQYARLADASVMGLPERDDPDLMVRVQAVSSTLSSHGGWLLVVDNVDTTEVQEFLGGFLPDTGAGGRLVLTSRIPDWSADFVVLPLDPLPPDEAAELLRRLSDDSSEDAVRVAEELAGLPLALEQAAAYCTQTGRDYGWYLQRFRAAAEQMIGQGGLPGQRTVATTYTLSIEQVRQADPGAAALLDLLAYLAPDSIPRFLLEEGEDGEDEWQDDEAWETEIDGDESDDGTEMPGEAELLQPLHDIEDVDTTVALLRRYSLVEASPEALRIHRMLQAAVRASHTTETHHVYAATAAGLVWDALPTLGPAAWSRYEQLLPHLLAVAEHLRAVPGRLDMATKMYTLAGLYQRDRGTYAGARAPLERALELAEEEYGPDDPRLLDLLHYLSIALTEWPQESLPLDRRALAIAERACDPDDERLLTAVTDLTASLWALGDPAAARPYAERAVRIAETEFGAEHLKSLAPVSNLGLVLVQLGETAAARPYLERAVMMAEAEFGAEDSEAYLPVSNLGLVLVQLGETAAARPYAERAVQMVETQFGPEHPLALVPLTNLGSVLLQLGQPAAAHPYLERALRIAETEFGAEHAQALAPVTTLSSVLLLLGQPNGARPHAERALRIAETEFGPDHPQALAPVTNLGSVLLQLGQPAASRPFAERALRIAETEFGTEHPQALLPLSNLSLVLLQLGQAAASRPFAERALRIAETEFGAEHAQALLPLTNLSLVLLQLGEPAAALPCAERAVRIAEAEFGPEHAQALQPLNNLGSALMQLGEPAAALPCAERAVRIAEAEFGADHPQALAPVSNLGQLLLQLGEPALAGPYLERTLEAYTRRYGGHSFRLIVPLSRLGRALAHADEDLGRAIEVLERAETLRDHFGVEANDEVEDLQLLAAALDQVGRSDEATQRRRDALALQRRLDALRPSAT